MRREDVGDKPGDVVQVPCKHDCLVAKPSGRQLSYKRVADWTNSSIVHKGVDEDHRTNAPLSTGTVGNTKETNDHQDQSHDDLAPDVERATTEPAHQEPGHKRADRSEGVLSE